MVRNKNLSKEIITNQKRLCKYISNINIKYISLIKNNFYTKYYQFLFLILFFLFLLVIKPDIIITATLQRTLNIYTNVIKLTINKKGYHKIYHGDRQYIQNVIINNNNAQSSEVGVYYFPNDHENDVELHFHFEEQNLSKLFYSCSNITKINFEDFDFSFIELMDGLFNGCTSLTSIEFGYIDSRNVRNMSLMFNDCISLKELALSKFNTTKVIDMQWMFHNCSRLTALDLSSFYTSSLENMEGMFSGDTKLISLKLNNFNTSKVTKMNKMFEKCESLETLDLSNFNTNIVQNMSYMFHGCSKLNYIDFTKLDLNFDTQLYNIIDKTSNLSIYAKDNKDDLSKIFSQYNFQDEYCNNNGEFNINCSYTFSFIENSFIYLCNEHYIKYIESDSYLVFKHEISCLNITNNLQLITDLTNQCPIYFNPSNEHDSFDFDYCIPNCPQDLPFLLIFKAKCVSHCSILEREKHECITNYKDKKGNFNGFDLVIEQIREEVINNFDESTINKKISRENDADIFLIKLNYDETIFNKDYSYKKYYSSKSRNSKRRNNYLSKNKESMKSLTKRKLDDIDNYYIHLEKCLNILKQEQDSLDIDNLFLLRTDVEQDGMKFPYFYFELYQKKSNNNLNIVSLSQCKDININIDINNAELKENINKYIPSSDYYNDICYTTKSDYNTDIILSRRQHNYIDFNMSVCGLNCEFIYYNKEDDKAVCSCGVKTEIPFLKDIRFDKKVLLNSFTKINNLMNIKMLKCYKTVFDKNNIFKNIGYYIITFLIVFNMVFIIVLFHKDYKKLLDEIQKFNSNNNSSTKTTKSFAKKIIIKI